MDDDIPEVWIEVDVKKGRNGSEQILFCQFYREQSELRGTKSRPGSEHPDKQMERIQT